MAHSEWTICKRYVMVCAPAEGLLMTSFLKFQYLYRDAANYKQYSAVCFANPTNLDLASIRQCFEEAAIDKQWFIARQVDLPELFFETLQGPDDHLLHEIESLELVSNAEEIFDPRTIEQFLQQFQQASACGWYLTEVKRERFATAIKSTGKDLSMKFSSPPNSTCPSQTKFTITKLPSGRNN